ncbi:hypothetical protein [Criblamydia sequanensis]|uniref:Uncharacterized protein n=1 Tax=Candidatus Criblamydia sequanensis CRIB-18 TaxID=1437425 RepID=A0A090D0S4_9BACT|nr:hypothetical protein [Criblamydia sequanensis]CDR35147.1 hypothetical protein CSEC_2341 [Criblamydia sequanensis CRIB-18]
MNQTNPNQTFNARCHFYPIMPTSSMQPQTPIRTPTKTYSRASLISRIEDAQRAAGTPPTQKKLGVDFKEKSIKKGTSPKKEVSEKEMNQIIRGLNSLGLADASLQDLRDATERTKVPTQTNLPKADLEKKRSRNKQLHIQMALIDYALRSKIPGKELGTGRLYLGAISLNTPKLGS